MTRDEQAIQKGFKVYESNNEYYKDFTDNIHLVVRDISMIDNDWQVKLMQYEGALYVAQKEIKSFGTLEEALGFAINLSPDDLEELLENEYEEME